jgi:riboflavin biosynthesis pyrimidine reductase
MVSSLDGAATGGDSLTGSLNNPVDKRVFDLLRATSDAVVVGAGTARTEGYGPVEVPIVLVSRSGDVPDKLRGAAPGQVLLGTTATARSLTEARDVLGDEHVLVTGEDAVDLPALLGQLHQRGLRRVLSEGGPSLLRELLAAHVVDELDLTWVPTVVAGDGPRITNGRPVDVPLDLALLLEEEGTLLGRWLVRR